MALNNVNGRHLGLGFQNTPGNLAVRHLRYTTRRSGSFTNVVARMSLLAPRVNNVFALTPTAGLVAYDLMTQMLYYADGTSWFALSTGSILPDPLLSIAALTTSGDEILYTTSTDTYATSPITPAGRSFLTAGSQAGQQAALGLIPGTDVQEQSLILDSVVMIGGGAANQLLYTTGGGYANTPVTSFARSSILTLNSTSALNMLLNTITGTVSTPNRLLYVTGSQTVAETGIVVDGSNNVTGINDLDISGNLTITGTLATLTQAELTQLANINGITIINTQWSYLGAMDQSVATSDTPTFTGLNANSATITNVLNPASAQDAATKSYVDSVASSGAPPLVAVRYATDGTLPTATYTDGAETLTATSNGALSVDGVAVSMGDRILVKNQGDDRENGIYVVTQTGDGSNPFILTRASDFNEAAMPISAGATVFVEVTGATTNPGSSWALGTTVSTVDPISDSPMQGDSVTWVQVAAGLTLTAGNGIDMAQFGSGTIAADLSARLTFTSNSIDLNTVAVPYGGTGQTTLTSNGVLVGQGTTAVDTSKAAPSGDFVGHNDAQTLTNKDLTSNTNDVTASALFSAAGANTINVRTAATPSVGQVLTAMSGTTATWQTPQSSPSFDQTFYVFATAPNVAPSFSTVEAALDHVATLSPALSEVNGAIIQVFPGDYAENIPLTIPAYVTLRGLTRQHTIIRPVAPAPNAAMIQLFGNASLYNLTIEGSDNNPDSPGPAYATIGISSTVALGTDFTLDTCDDITVRNCSLYGFHVAGNTMAQFSKILLCKNTSAQVTVGFPFVMETGYYVTDGGLLAGNDQNASGFLSAGGLMTQGYNVENDFSFADVTQVGISSCDVGIRVGSGVTSNTLNDYPIFRVIGANLGLISTIGIHVREKAVLRMHDLRVQDDTGLYPSQIHLQIDNPSLPANPNFIAGLWSNLRDDKIVVSGAQNNPPVLRGANLSEVPGEIQNQFAGEVIVGRPGNGFEFAAGEGDSYTAGLTVFRDEGGAFTDVSIAAANLATLQIEVDIATPVAIDLTSAPATIDGVAPVSGMTRVLVKDGSTANPGTTSVDNGIYVWNGAGSAMTRATDFAAGSRASHETWISVDTGTVNYGTNWKIDATTFVGDVITIATTAFGFEVYTFQPFTTTASNNDAMYIGATLPRIPFPGIKMQLTTPIELTAGTDIDDVLTWEYWDGSTWSHLPIMVTRANIPYTIHGSVSFGYTTTPPANSTIGYHYRFRTLDDWATTLVNGVTAYWVRVRLIDVTNLTHVPIVEQIKLHTNHMEINENGFQEFFGTARPRQKRSIPISALLTTGNGDADPLTQRLVFSTSGSRTVSFNMPSCTFPNGVVTSTGFTWQPPENLDTSEVLCLLLTFGREQNPAGSGTIALQVNYCFVQNDDIVGHTTPSPTAQGFTVSKTATISTDPHRTFQVNIELDMEPLRSEDGVMAIMISRVGPDGYSRNVYLTSIGLKYAAWAPGNSG